MTLSDQNIATILLESQAGHRAGFGDVQMMCFELQERRSSELVDIERQGNTPVPDEVTNVELMDDLLRRIQKKEFFNDGQILAMFHALKKEGYFQQITFVDSAALRRVLQALDGDSYLIRELQATRRLPRNEGEVANPIDQLNHDLTGEAC